MRLIFARHGESEANVLQIISNRDLPHSLTQKGRTQAQALAERLAERRVVALYASPILRAQQTARIIADRLGLPVNTAKALSEIDCGIMEGRGDEAAWQAHQDVVAAWDTGTYERRIEGGECFNEVKARFGPFVQELIEQFAYIDGDVVLISHGSLLHHMLPLVLTNIDRNFTTQVPLGNCVYVVAVPNQAQLVCEQWAEKRL
jgi:2,3-bisphosphoglycerate-dependent phosphoglycerate mutase